MAEPLRIGIVGVGKIARDQHLPALAASPDFRLITAASRSTSVDGVPSYAELPQMLDAHPELDAVTICTPPVNRTELVGLALARGKAVMVEKPPAATLSEVEHMRALADAAGRPLFATWHARYAACVEPARAWLAHRRIRSVRIDWREDVRRWHPGQAWVWEPGGLGVFDPGINALSIATRILPRPFFLTEATLQIPANRTQPIAADLEFRDTEGVEITAGFDWRQTGEQTWTICVDTDDGVLSLADGGARLTLDGAPHDEGPNHEYPRLYARFAQLIRAIRSDVDVSPMRHVADAFLLGRREVTEAFED